MLASGRILLDGREVNLAELEQALQEAKRNGAAVQYSRENPASKGPAEVDAVIKLIAANRLRISLSPETEPAKSETIEFPGLEVFFSKVRRKAAASRGVSLVRKPQRHFILPAPAEGAINPQMIEGVKSVVPSEQLRNVAAIAAPDALSGDPSQAPRLADIARHVPFFGLLIGLAYIGHAVWIFEASNDVLAAGCEEADILIVDSDALSKLPSGWPEDIGRVMRNANILVYDRDRQRVGAVRTAGEVPGRIEFPN